MTSPLEYSAIKSGIISITKYLSKYYKKRNLRVNCISPGGIANNQPIYLLKIIIIPAIQKDYLILKI